MPSIDLNTLASDLRAKATADSQIVLNESVFDQKVREGIRAAFALASDEDLTIRVKEIPDPADGALIISGAKASVLQQTDLPVRLIFTTPNGGALQAIMRFDTSSGWTFSDSFKALDVFPFKELQTSGAHFVYSTVERKAFAWPGEQSTIDLEPGLNFFSNVTFTKLSKLLKLLKPVIGETSLSLKMGGPFASGNGDGLPVGKLRAPLLSDKQLAVGVNPFELTLGDLAVAVQVEKTEDEIPAPRIDLLLEAKFQQQLNVAIAIPAKGGALEVTTKPLPNYHSIDALIGSVPGGSIFTDFITHLPTELTTVFTNLTLDNFAMRLSSDTAAVSYVGLSITTTKSWTIVPKLVLEQLRLDIEKIQPADLDWTRVRIEATAEFLKDLGIFPGWFDFAVELQKDTSWKVSTISGAYYGSVNLGTLASKLIGGAPVPSFLSGIEFTDFGVTVDREGGRSNYTIYGSAEASFPILDHDFSAALSVVVRKTASGHEGDLGGTFAIGDQAFSFSLKLGDSKSEIEASWENEETPLGLADIASAFGWDMPAVPEGLDLALKKASFNYNFKDKTVVLTAESANYGQMVFVSFSTDEKRVHVFSIDVPLDLKFSEAPLVGDSLRIDPPVGIDNLQLIIASGEIESTEDVDALESLIPKSLKKGITLAANIEMNGPQEIVLPLTGGEKKEEEALLLRDSATPYKAEPKWINLKKTLGPVTFDKVGVQYHEGTLRFLINAALSAAGLTLSVDGLSVGSSLKSFDPKFDLRGIGIEYKAGDIEIGGAFMRVADDQYDGAAIIKTSQFTLSAIGSYAKVKDEPSIFIYAFLDYPLGGPSFFFVTGLAAGFGYNRRLIAPSIDDIAKFPLITQAITKKKPGNLTEALTSLQTYIPPTSGSIFLAVGVKFNSFKLVDSFALLTIEFGNNLVINLLGLSTAIVPTPTGDEKITPLAQVQIAWKASFDPDEGCLGIDARLTPNSYILSKDCRLSGGFAFYSWFTGPHAGDFVQTLGGYHPDFVIPKHYPRVPRLAFDWRVSNSLTIQGNAYYALTGSALMAGGHLEVLYRQGELRAWLMVGADFLIAWKPYHYDARLYVNVGASYTFDINLLFTRIRATISVDVGAHLHLWGPDFSGTARIDLSVISFTIAFGAGASQALPPLKDWSTFAQSFLPEKDVCSISLKDGLVKKIESAKEERWVINPKDLSLVIDSAVPFKKAYLTVAPTQNLVTGSTLDFGVGPMAKKAGQFGSNVIVSIKKGDDDVDSEFSYTLVRKTVPVGLWGEEAKPRLNSESQFIKLVPAGIEITPGKQPDAGATSTIDLGFSDFYYPKGGPTASASAYQWERDAEFAPQDMKAPARRKIIEEGIENNRDRDSLLADLGMKVTINVKATIAGEFMDAPQIGTLEIVRA